MISEIKLGKAYALIIDGYKDKFYFKDFETAKKQLQTDLMWKEWTFKNDREEPYKEWLAIDEKWGSSYIIRETNIALFQTKRGIRFFDLDLIKESKFHVE